MPSKPSIPMPPRLIICRDDGEATGTVGENKKFDNLFCYVKLTEDDVAKLEAMETATSILMELVLYASVVGYAVKLTPAKEDDVYKASLTGLAGSPNPAYAIMVDASDPYDAMTVLFYKAQKIGFPGTYRLVAKEKAARPRFS